MIAMRVVDLLGVRPDYWLGWQPITAPPFVRPLPPLRPCSFKCGPALCPGHLSRLCERDDYPREGSEE